MRARPKTKFIVGIDEVGRGPLAGPVLVGAVIATPAMIRKFRAIKESKQLSPRAREEWYARITAASGPSLKFAVSFVGPAYIDERGINAAIRLALTRSLKKLGGVPEECMVLLDGGLYAPKAYTRQETIVRGDASETIIAMASVVAKVERDRYMIRLHEEIPAYAFAAHKGYGTALHIRLIKKHGLTPEHRRTFLRRIIHAPSIKIS